MKFDEKKLAMAMGVTLAAIYVLWIILMKILPPATLATWMNSLAYGMNVSSLMNWKMTGQAMGMGLVANFVCGWVFGYLLGWFYNNPILKRK